MNLLFDMGEVLVRVDPARIVRQVATATDRPAELVEEVLFGRGLKDQFDRGRLSPLGFWQEVRSQLDVEISFTRLAVAYADIFSPITETLDLLVLLRRLGYRTYLLSNTDPFHLARIQARWPAVARMDGLAVSFDLEVAKPDPRFFHAALTKLDLREQIEQCIFFDDRSENIQAAQAVGLQSVLVTSPAVVMQTMRQLGIMPNDLSHQA